MQDNKIRHAAVVLTSMVVAGMANAEVPAVVGTSITAMTADATSIFSTVFPFVAAVMGLVIVVKLFKRFTNKA